MCTALSLTMGGHYFGRTLDLDGSYGEKICIVPRRHSLTFSRMAERREHYAIIGMAVTVEGRPLFYDGANEKGLCMAGLNFPESAVYHPEMPGKDNVSAFELIPWVLCQCAGIREAQALLSRVNLTNVPFRQDIPAAPLHWLISDAERSLVVESTEQGLQIHENPLGVLTNEPPFPIQRFSLNNLRALRSDTPENTFSRKLALPEYCQGLGGLGLPGDLSSMSRFQRVGFYASHNVWEGDPVSQFFHLLGTVEMPRGGCRTAGGVWDITVYTSCIHGNTGRYYYTTYENRSIQCVDLHAEDLEGEALAVFELERNPRVTFQNSKKRCC